MVSHPFAKNANGWGTESQFVYAKFDVLGLSGSLGILSLPNQAVAAVRSAIAVLAFFGRRRSTAVTPSEKFCVKISTMWM